MATSTHKIGLVNEAYVNVSNGNLNCSIGIGKNKFVRLVVSGTEPSADTEDYVPVAGPSSGNEYAFASVTNLAEEDDVWLRADGDPSPVYVIRGPAVFTT